MRKASHPRRTDVYKSLAREISVFFYRCFGYFVDLLISSWRRVMGKRKFHEYLPDQCHRRYSCVHCRAHLANHDELISKVRSPLATSPVDQSIVFVVRVLIVHVFPVLFTIIAWFVLSFSLSLPLVCSLFRAVRERPICSTKCEWHVLYAPQTTPTRNSNAGSIASGINKASLLSSSVVLVLWLTRSLLSWFA